MRTAAAITGLQRGRAVEASKDLTALNKYVLRGTLPTGRARYLPDDVPETLRRAPWYTWPLVGVGVEEVAYVRTLVANHGGSLAELRDDVPRIRVTTIHDAKGAEADHVILWAKLGRWTKQAMQYNADVRFREARVRYVGITRAKESVTWVQTR